MCRISIVYYRQLILIAHFRCLIERYRDRHIYELCVEVNVKSKRKYPESYILASDANEVRTLFEQGLINGAWKDQRQADMAERYSVCELF